MPVNVCPACRREFAPPAHGEVPPRCPHCGWVPAAEEVVYETTAHDDAHDADLVDPELDLGLRVVKPQARQPKAPRTQPKRRDTPGPSPWSDQPPAPADDVDTPPDDLPTAPDQQAATLPYGGAARSRHRKGKSKQSWLRRVRWPAAVLLTAACGVLLWYYWPREQPDEQWQAAVAEFQDHKWASAQRKLERFAELHPDDPRVAAIPFFHDMAAAGDQVYSTTGDPLLGLAGLQKVFQKHRDGDAYKDYSLELYQAAARLVERLTEEAVAAQDSKPLDQARQAAELLQTVAVSREEDWIPGRNRTLLTGIEHADRAIRDAQAKAELITLLTAAGDVKSQRSPDEVYARANELLREHAAWEADKEVQNLREAAYAAEPARARFVAEPADAEPTSLPSDYDRLRQGNSVAVVWGEAASPADAARVLALARGVLYVFDSGGRLCWARRLGIDVDRLPQSVPATATSPPALIAVSTEDNTLLALNASNGQVLWRYHVGQDTAAPLLIVPRAGSASGRLGLLPTADGEIHVIELVLGRRLGKIVVGQPLTVGGAYDPETELAYFPADAKRIFAVDVAAVENAQRPVCPSILFSDHASGSLRAPPVCVGPYLILCEASGLDHTRLRAFRIKSRKDEAGTHKLGFARPTDRPLRELQLRGWTWFGPHATPDRITLVTDEGDLGLYGLNLDYIDEALYSLVDAQATQGVLSLNGHGPQRTLVIDAQDELLWIMAGGTLQKFSIDLLGQKIKALWRAGAADLGGAAVHEAQVDARGLYLTTMSPSGRLYQTSAVDAESGTLRWQRRLGSNCFGDPLVGKDAQGNDRVVLVDDSGRTIGLVPGEKLEPSDVPRLRQLRGDEPLPAGVDPQRLMLLGEPPDPVCLAAPLADGAKLAVKLLDFKPPTSDAAPAAAWATLALPARLAGRPCLSGERLVVPCADGQMHRLRWNGGPSAGKEVSATWRPKDARLAAAEAELWPVGQRDVVAIVGGRLLQTFTLTEEQGATQLRRAGEPFVLERPLRGKLLIDSGRALVFDETGTLHAVDLATRPGALLGRWPLGLNVTAGPVLRGEQVIAVVDDRRLVALPRQPPADMQKPLWTSDEFQGRIQGLPTLAGDVLLVADNSRRVTGVRVSDGQTRWHAPLRVRTGPAAAPVPYGRDRVLVPLVDGTLLLLAVPKAEQEATP